MNAPGETHEHAGRRAARIYALIFILLATGITATGYVYYSRFAQHYRAKVEQDLTTIGDQKVRELVQFRRVRLADAAILFKNASFSALIRRLLEEPKDVDTRRQLEIWMEKYRQAGAYDVVRLLDAHGVTQLSSPAGLTPVTSVVLLRLPEILRSGQVTFQDFHRNEFDHRVYLDLLIPVLDEQHADRPLGVLYLRIDPTVAFFPALARWPIPTATAESKLVRRDGDAVLYLSELRTRKGTLLNERVPLTDTARTAVMAVLGRQGIVHGVDKPGNPVVGYVRAVPDSPWFLVLREEDAEAYAPVREQLWLTIGLVAALLVGSAVGFLALWRGERVRFYRNREKAAVERERLVASLQQALAEVKTLSGLLPICSYCKKIRDDGNFWHNVESYMTEHSDITFSHGMCPDCMRKHHPEFADEVLNRG